MDGVVPAMERQQEHPTGAEHALQLSQDRAEVGTRNMDEGVIGHNSAPHRVPDVQGQHVALGEVDPGIQPPGMGDHGWRQIDALDRHPTLV
jgi:hypothetical protein